MRSGKLFAISDLHVGYAQNRDIVERLRPESGNDWLIVAGDVGELFDDVRWALTLMSERFCKVFWAPGNHELWAHPADPIQMRGDERYRCLVGMCRDIGVLTPEDDYVVWRGSGGPVTIAPLFVLYDYSFRAVGTSRQESLTRALSAGVPCADEQMLFPDPYPSREAWCRARVDQTLLHLAARDCDIGTVLVSHFPLLRESAAVLGHSEFAQWCGTDMTASWHRRFSAAAVVYGHLHMPGTTWHDGVRFEEVSLGYPLERRSRHSCPSALRPVFPD
ncbi:MAG: metallophosphoesterase family protein [Acidimicrobiales bacterium]